MVYVDTGSELPGIAGLLEGFPRTGKPMGALAQALLRGDSPLTSGERELVAAYVSDGNDCEFCRRTHGAVASRLLGDDAVDDVLQGSDPPDVDERMEALLGIAESVRACDDDPSPAQIEAAREAGADDEAIHDTVLVAAAFCMFNRYVDGLEACTPESQEAYEGIAQRLAADGYGGR